jgi:hypothetical protein
MIAGTAGNITGTTSISTNTLVTNSLIVNGYELFSNNDISVNRITANIWTGIFTANVTESASNLYFTNARVYANVIGLIGNKANVSDLTTANVIETTSNLYFTNARVYANVIGLIGNKANVSDLTTANVSELTNLYYTNARVYANVIGLIGNKANVSDLTTSNIAELTNLYYTNARVYANVIGLIGNKANVVDLTTANVIESTSNLYFTNARVYSNVLTLLPTLAGDNIVIAANGRISATGITSIVTSVVGSLTTANVTEVASNLYYTNTRSRAALTAGPGILYDSATGVISSLQNTSSASNVTFAELTVTGNVKFYGNVTTFNSNNFSISDNMIYLNNGSSTSNPDLGFAGNYNDGSYKHTGFFRDATDGVWKVFDNYTPEPDASQFIDTAHGSFRLANLSATAFIGNVVGTVSSIGNFSTTSLSEGTNLYYTNARVVSNITAFLPAYNGVILASNITTTSLTANTINVVSIYGSATGGSITGADLISANNITATNITATYIVTGSGPGGSLTGANLLSTNNISSINWIGLYASNVIESGNTTSGNVFFSNARAIGAFVAGSGINIAANGQISATASSSATSIVGLNTANVSESASNLYFTNARVFSNVISLLPTYTGNLSAGNLNITGGITDTTGILTIATTGGTNANIELSANGAGRISLDGMYWPLTDGTVGQALQTNGTGNLYWGTVATTATSITGLNTANVSESASNLYYTNARVYANVVSLLTTYTGNISAGNISTGGATGGFITGANLITSNNITVTNLTATNLNIIGGITDNSGILTIATTGGTNANIELTANGTGRISLDGMYWPPADGTVGQVLQTSGTGNLSWTSTVTGATSGQTQLAITNSQVLSGGNQNYTLLNSANSANTVLVTINGLVQTPITDYTISGLTGLVFAANTPANATIEVKTYGYSAVDPNDVILKQLVRSASYAFSRIFY